ncbi:hypothetical protein L9F63_006622, partial [Diploptera punctata]
MSELPPLPIVDDDGEPSHLVQELKKKHEFPPLMMEKSWTKAVPYRDSSEYLKPSESIGSCYTPSARKLKIQDLPPRRRKLPKQNFMLDENGKLKYPPKIRKVESFEKEKEYSTPGIVKLQDLLSGKYHEQKLKKQEKKALKQAHMAKQRRLKEEEEYKKEKQMLAQMEAEQPIHPDDQLKMLKDAVEYEQQLEVRKEDIYRIEYYLTKGIRDDMIEPFPEYLLIEAKKRVGDKYMSKKEYSPLIAAMENEILSDYYISIRKAIFKYIMEDPAQRKRLNILTLPVDYPAIIIRAPVPWHCNYVIASQLLQHKLFICNPVLLCIRDLWELEYSNMVIVPVERLMDEYPPPIESEKLEIAVENYCTESLNILKKRWLPQCAEIFLGFKEYWKHLVPKTSGESLKLVKLFFECACTLMSMQIRRLVMKSLSHFLKLIALYKGGNDFGDVFEDCTLNNRPLACFDKIIEVNNKLPRVDLLFPEFAEEELFLHAVHLEEVEVQEIIDESLKSYNTNLVGPYTYLKSYEPYFHILRGEARENMLKFMATDPFPLLKDFTRRIDKYNDLKNEICFLRRVIPLNFISLDCNELNDTLWNLVDELRNHLVDYHVNNNRTHNREICDTFDKMSNRASELPETTAELVELQNYINECRDVTMYQLREKIRTTAENVIFLMQHAILPPEDIQLNSRTFIWPKDMEAVLELSQTRLTHRREMVEGVLKSKRYDFDAKIYLLKNVYDKELEIFKKKDPPILTKEEMEENVQIIEHITALLTEDKAEAEAINEEEQLLDFDPSSFLVLQNMLNVAEPLDRLWHIVYNFHMNHDKWYYGPFLLLDADEVKEEVDNMWRTLYKLAKTLYDIPGAKRIAEMVRAKVEKFRQYVPVLQVVCNKGLQDRHWTQ